MSNLREVLVQDLSVTGWRLETWWRLQEYASYTKLVNTEYYCTRESAEEAHLKSIHTELGSCSVRIENVTVLTKDEGIGFLLNDIQIAVETT